MSNNACNMICFYYTICLLFCVFKCVFGSSLELPSAFPRNSTSKLVMNNLKDIESNDVIPCELKYHYSKDCPIPGVDNSWRDPRRVLVSQTEYNDTTYLVQLDVLRLKSRSVTLYIIGEDFYQRQKCVTASCMKQHEAEVTFSLQRIILPLGNYSLVCYTPDSEECRNFSGRLLVRFQIPSRPKVPGVEQIFPSTDKEERKSFPKCTFSRCFANKNLFSHKFDSLRGVLRFFFNLPWMKFCKEPITLLKHSSPWQNMTREKCGALKASDPMDNFQQFRCLDVHKYNRTVVEFEGLPSGCYAIKVAGGCFYKNMWLKNDNYVDMDTWPSRTRVTPRSHDSSIEVIWSEPGLPFNFKKWNLQLWSTKIGYNVTCIGDNPRNVDVTIVKVDTITTNSYNFYNLSEGSYCVIITPEDSKCPFSGCKPSLIDGCAPKASSSVILNAPNISPVANPSIDVWLIILLVVGGSLLAIGTALFCCKIKKVSFVARNEYKQVQPLNAFKKLPIILIWTNYTPENQIEITPLVKAFKILLREYYKCTVYDYLEPKELPRDEANWLLSNPVGWLQSHLKSDIKKVFVASEGAVRLQDLHSKQVDLSPVLAQMEKMDSLMFPFVLRYIQDSLQCASDYERIFQVSFTQVSLQGIAINICYDMPSHITQFKARLHGVSKEEATGVLPPTNEQLKPLRAAIETAKNSSTKEHLIENV